MTHLQNHFDIVNSTTVSLPGDTDRNVRVDTPAGTYLLKISSPKVRAEYLDFQQDILHHLRMCGMKVARPLADRRGNFVTRTDQGEYLRLLTFVPGRIYQEVNPKTDELRYSIGRICGLTTAHLQNFEHPGADRYSEWDPAQAMWTTIHLPLLESDLQPIARKFLTRFKDQKDRYRQLRRSIVHADVNDHNIIVSDDRKDPKAVALIDFGDAVRTQIINDVAIGCCYLAQDLPDPMGALLPFISGYHKEFPLLPEELGMLPTLIGVRLIISLTKAAINRKLVEKKEYHQVSVRTARDLLRQLHATNFEFLYYRFRQACEMTAHPNEKKFRHWASRHQLSLNTIFPTGPRSGIHQIDLSTGSTLAGPEWEFSDLELFSLKMEKLRATHPDKFLVGGYLEPRALYTAPGFEQLGNRGAERRTVHLGLDVWLPWGKPVCALLPGQVYRAGVCEDPKDYGGFIILKHQIAELEFYTLYGHLVPGHAYRWDEGDYIGEGEIIARLGSPEENGGWAPHLHFQIMLSMLGNEDNFPGVALPSEREVWASICPDPNLLLKDSNLKNPSVRRCEDLLDFRKKHLGRSLSTSYQQPLQMLRGDGAYLIDEWGQRWLDTVNNVAHVGHEHPAVVRAGQQQMGLLNTNTRYLHPAVEDLTRELLKTLPPELSVLHFVNSGSEANELALRMAYAATGSRHILASESGYHGNTHGTVNVSSYKFDGKGGLGAPEETHLFLRPDEFRGRYRGEDAGKRYVKAVERILQELDERHLQPAALILEPILSCGGQIVLPEDFLPRVYELVREAGGLCISDEVQTGCGRVGSHYWGFQLYDVVPDIVTIGKPLGNGHPVAAVACTEAVADAFANGMEYFNTFGGNPVSCVIATEVLRTVEREELQQQALQVGNFLKEELKKFSTDFPIIGDVRGHGLFLGFELTDSERRPMPLHATYLAERMKHYRILMSTDGPDYNVLKIKPPLVFSMEDAKKFLGYLRKVLSEDYFLL